jgi:hypothetical protein
MFRILARNITSNASPATGTIPTTPSSATLASIRLVTCQGAPSARLTHQPQRKRGRDEIADHRDQSDDAVDAVADVGTGQHECNVEQSGDGIEPRQPLLTGEMGKRIGAGMAEIEPEAAKLRTEHVRRYLAPFLIDNRTDRVRAAEGGSGGAPGASAPGASALGIGASAGIEWVVRHGHQMGNARSQRKLRRAATSYRCPLNQEEGNGGCFIVL